MLHKIVEAHLSGQSCRKIAAWTVPPVSFNSISRYMKEHVQPVIGNAEALKFLLRANKEENKPLPPEIRAGTTPEQVDQLAIRALYAAPALHIRENRIRAKQERLNRLCTIVNERGEDMAAVPGGSSGFLARDFKGSGENIQEVYKFDGELYKAFDETEKAIAIERNEWQENTGGQGVSVQIVCPWVGSPDQMPRVSFAAPDAIAAPDDDEVEMEIGLLK